MDIHTIHEVVSTASKLPGLLADLIQKGEVEAAQKLLRAWDEKTMTYMKIYEVAMAKLNEK